MTSGEEVAEAQSFSNFFLSYQVGKSGLVDPRAALMEGEVERGFRRRKAE